MTKIEPFDTSRLAHAGTNLQIDPTVRIYGAERVSIGDGTRIDANTVISAGSGHVTLGRYVHVSTHVLLIGAGGIDVEDYAGVASHVSIYSASDNYTSGHLAGPCIPTDLTNPTVAPVHIGLGAVAGSHTVVLPGTHMGRGSTSGAHALVRGTVEDYAVMVGIPARRTVTRDPDVFERQVAELDARFDVTR